VLLVVAGLLGRFGWIVRRIVWRLLRRIVGRLLRRVVRRIVG